MKLLICNTDGCINQGVPIPWDPTPPTPPPGEEPPPPVSIVFCGPCGQQIDPGPDVTGEQITAAQTQAEPGTDGR